MDLSKPLWEVLHSLNVQTSEAASVAIFRIHHSLGDGVSIVSPAVLAWMREASDANAFPSFPVNKKKTMNACVRKRPLFFKSYLIFPYFFYDNFSTNNIHNFTKFLRLHDSIDTCNLLQMRYFIIYIKLMGGSKTSMWVLIKIYWTDYKYRTWSRTIITLSYSIVSYAILIMSFVMIKINMWPSNRHFGS